jgi:hypothetical protein
LEFRRVRYLVVSKVAETVDSKAPQMADMLVVKMAVCSVGSKETQTVDKMAGEMVAKTV